MTGVGGTVECGNGGDPPLNDEARRWYVEKAMASLALTSRTAGGTVDTSASVEKAAYVMAELSNGEVARLAYDNFRAVIEGLYDSRCTGFASPEGLRGFVEQVVRRLNLGLTREGVLYRVHDSSKYPSYTLVRDLPAAADQFFAEFFDRLSASVSASVVGDSTVDPVGTAAWIEYRMDRTDHFWADGCGRSAKAVATWVLMRYGHALPTYPPDRAAHFAYAPTAPRTAAPEVVAAQYRAWVDYYRTLFVPGLGE